MLKCWHIGDTWFARDGIWHLLKLEQLCFLSCNRRSVEWYGWQVLWEGCLCERDWSYLPGSYGTCVLLLCLLDVCGTWVKLKFLYQRLKDELADHLCRRCADAIKYYNNANHLQSFAGPCGGNKTNHTVISLHSVLSSVAWIIFFKKIWAYTQTHTHKHTCGLCMMLCLTWFTGPVISAHGTS